MFDIGFAELMLIAVVGLLVIGPERLPGAIRTTAAWINRFRRGFDEVRAEVQRELHNDAVMRELRDSAKSVEQEIRNTTDALQASVDPMTPDSADASIQPDDEATPTGEVPPGPVSPSESSTGNGAPRP